MRMFLVATLVGGLLGCSSTNVVSGHHAAALRHGGHRDAFSADDVRIGPSSKLRFCRRVLGCSDWIWASDLRVDDTGAWVDRSSGYRWSEVDYVEVKGFDGIKTTGAIVGITAGVAIIIPIALVAASLKAMPTDGPAADGGRSFSSAGASKALALAGVVAEAAAASAVESESEPDEPEAAAGGGFYWGATLRGGGATSASARKLFTTGARVRQVIALGAHADSSVASAKDLVTGGVVARLRLGNFFELGAGARVAHTKGMDGAWDTSRMYVVQGGFHSPVTARFALPLGVDVAWGNGELAREIQIPWGFRYTSPTGRWTGTLHPLTPAYARRADADKGRWAINVGLELGVTL